MGDEIIIAFYIAVPIVLLASAFVYYLSRRGEDIEKVNEAMRNQTEDKEAAVRPGQPEHGPPTEGSPTRTQPT